MVEGASCDTEPTMSDISPSFRDYEPSSKEASRLAAANRRKDTRCELLLRKCLWRRGLRYRKNVPDLPGKPDIVFKGQRVAVFCDGDFWHGRHWETRRRKLSRGANPGYWIRKIEANRERDRIRREELERRGWLVLRLWETDILKDPEAAAGLVASVLNERDGGGKREQGD